MESKTRSSHLTTKPAPSSQLRLFAIVGVTLLSVALGGTTELWAQALIALLAAGLIMLFPPRQIAGKWPMVILFVFMLLALAAFLPAEWGPVPEWKRHLSEDLKVPLGPFRTPQPWLTLQGCGLLFLGLTWTAYLLGQGWNNAEKSQVLRLLVTGIILLAAVAIISYVTGYRIPVWKQELNRGWFPNRNQSADVLAVAGILNYAIAFRSLQKKQRLAAFWVTGMVVLGAALIICYSRAGILMLFGGIGLWHVSSLFQPQKLKSLAMGASATLLLLSLFLLFGGSTLERFITVPDGSNPNVEDYRISIQQDAVTTSLHSPFLGVGLGNFEPVFASMRQASAGQNRMLHPESDWLWMAVEMGWFAPLLVLVGLKWWAGECMPFEQKQGESLRRAAMVAATMFIFHGLVDVSGHRVGSLFVGLLIASVALSPKSCGFTPKWNPFFFRGTAMFLALLSAWWIGSICKDWGPPTTATLDRLQAKMDLASSEGKLASLSEAANAALEIEPLDWTFYFHRASAETFRNGGTEDAENDFAIARFLEPHSIDLCVEEGEVWLGAGDAKRCLEAWHEALRRSGPQGVKIYSTLLRLAQNNPDVHHGLEDVAGTDVEYLITFLNYATPEEEKSELDDLLSRDPNLQSLNSDQQSKLFSAWYARGNQDDLADLLLSHTQFQIAGWKFLAEHFAAKQDFELACMTTLRYLPQPAAQPEPVDPASSAQPNHFNNHPDDIVEGIKLCQAQVQDNQIDEALDTIAKLERLKGCPPYIFYLKAQLCVKKQLWEQAWNALQQIDGA
jgi:hypothetical protein